MSDGILLIAEQRDGALNKTSFEALVAAQFVASELNQKISVAVLGAAVGSVASEIAAKKVDEVYTVQDAKLSEYTPDGYVWALRQVLDKLDPRFVILSHTYQTRDFAPILASALGKTCVTDCIGVRTDGGEVVFTRQVFQGKITTDVRVSAAPPVFASFQSGSYRADKAEAGASPAAISAIQIDMSGANIRSAPEEKFQ